jgi:hypothetical protein
VVITDTLDSKVHLVDVTPDTDVTGPNPLIFNVGTLSGDGGVISYTVRVTVTDVTSDGSITNWAALSSNEMDGQESTSVSHPVLAVDDGKPTYLPSVHKGPMR